jgi:predicted transglutaminase-like cysteine proteinase
MNLMQTKKRQLLNWIFISSSLICLVVGSFAVAFDYDKLQASYVQKFGLGALSNFNAWHLMMLAVKDLKDEDKLKRVNEFFNRRVAWGEDQIIWGQLDYWATPIETIGKGLGDCEDFAIAKYFTLVNLGIPIAKLRLVYVKAKVSNLPNSQDQAHMVLAYYPNPQAEPLIMDNQITEIRPASRRPDLMPIFSFNSEGIYLGVAGNDEQSGRSKLSRWQDLLQRVQLEGLN